MERLFSRIQYDLFFISAKNVSSYVRKSKKVWVTATGKHIWCKNICSVYCIILHCTLVYTVYCTVHWCTLYTALYTGVQVLYTALYTGVHSILHCTLVYKYCILHCTLVYKYCILHCTLVYKYCVKCTLIYLFLYVSFFYLKLNNQFFVSLIFL